MGMRGFQACLSASVALLTWRHMFLQVSSRGLRHMSKVRLSMCLPAGAAILCCGKLAASELHCLTAAPRLAIHEALAAPHKYLGTPYELGLSSRMDDACIAYQLFLEVTPAITL